jgi:dipeptidyl aminopeptidase/acylaminoacyl peptidase
VGNPKNDQEHELMKAKSPITHVDKITRPLLIVHGGEDTIVSSEESDRMVEAMQKAGKQVEYVFFPDEGHSFQKWENWSVLYEKIEVFLATQLGGRR